MGKPRMIILVRHAQSEGNLNRDVHQIIPDHRVKLTQEGWKQAEEAGRRLRDMLRPDDTIRVFTSPYRRTRETTEGILRSLTESNSDCGPSPFSRSAIKVYEEPRLREQDFGNFQPCSAEMERMWQERADYGHFFYRIPNGESAADAYDRCSGFNESLWRNFSEDDFPSICILVTHGLMTRVFLMKWYHWSVEYFEDLRNVNHCEFVIMKREENGKFALQNKLRTWSELKRRATVTNKEKPPPTSTSQVQSPNVPKRVWGGCINGCSHDHTHYPRQTRLAKEGTAASPSTTAQSPKTDTATPVSTSTLPTRPAAGNEHKTSHDANTSAYLKSNDPTTSTPSIAEPSPPSPPAPKQMTLPSHPAFAPHFRGRDAGGSESGISTPLGDGITSDPFDATAVPSSARPSHSRHVSGLSGAGEEGDEMGDDVSPFKDRPVRRLPRRRTTVEELEAWKEQSGMGRGTRADALGDPESEEEGSDEAGEGVGRDVESLAEVEREEMEDKSVRGSVY